MQSNQYIYIMFSQTGTWFSNFLRFWTRTKYNHTSISFVPDLEDLYSFGRISIKEKPWEARFITEGARRGVYAEKPNTTAHVFRLPVTKAQLDGLWGVIDEFSNEAPKYKYNIAGLPHIWLGIAWERKYKYACSQFVAYALQRAGCLDMPKHYSLMKPKDLYKLVDDSVYEGLLRDFCAQVDLVK